MPRKTSESAVPAAETKKKTPSTAKKSTRSREAKTKATAEKKSPAKTTTTQKTATKKAETDKKPRTKKEPKSAEQAETVEVEVVQEDATPKRRYGKNNNLVSIGERTTEEQRQITRKGGIASGKSRREKKNLREFGKDFLMQSTSPVFKGLMQTHEVDQDDMTNAAALFVRMFQKAMTSGDLNAARQVVEWAGMAPLQEMRENEAIARMAQVIQLAEGTDDENASTEEDVIFYIPENGRPIITDDDLVEIAGEA